MNISNSPFRTSPSNVASASPGASPSVLVQLISHLPGGDSLLSNQSGVSYKLLSPSSPEGSDVQRVEGTRDGGGEAGDETHVVTVLLFAVGIVAFVFVVVCVVLYIVKRSKLDKIRHHLMPLYNFDPTDEEPHWEQDLMEDDREQQIALNQVHSASGPKLKFHGGLDM